MKCDTARALHTLQEKRNIARPFIVFCFLSNKTRIDIKNQFPAAIPAPSAKYRMDIGAPQHLQKFAQASLARPGEVTIRTRDIGTIVGFKAEGFELSTPLIQ